MNMLQALVNSGISEATLLIALLMILAFQELVSGIEVRPIIRIRHYLQFSAVPIGVLLVILAVMRILHLV